MSCLGFMSAAQRAALAASTAEGTPLSSFASPPPTDAKVRRVRLLSRSPNPAIRESAALSALAPADVLTALALDEVDTVRCCVARNEKSPASVLHTLTDDHCPQVRGWVAANRSTPTPLRAALTHDPDPGVRAVVAWAAGWD